MTVREAWGLVAAGPWTMRNFSSGKTLGSTRKMGRWELPPFRGLNEGPGLEAIQNILPAPVVGNRWRPARAGA